MSDAASKKKAALAASVAAATASDEPVVATPKRKRAAPAVKKESVPRTASPVRSSKPIDPRLRTFLCTDHPVLFGGRPGIVVCARDEDQARIRVIEELSRRGIPVEGKISFRELGIGEVFMFQ